MPNDAKLGLIAGVTIVIVVAAVFFRKEPGLSTPRTVEAAAVAAPAHNMSRSVKHEAAEERRAHSGDDTEIP